MYSKTILLSHGSGGAATHELIRSLFLKKLKNPLLAELSDSAILPSSGAIAFTTDSFVMNPLIVPGADIGKLCVCGTLNDLAVQGAIPQYLSLAMIIEEGLSYALLEKIVQSIADTARKAKVRVVTGDLKVVEKGACDKLFITTSGIARLPSRVRLSAKNIRPGDAVIVTGAIAEHGLSVLSAREDLGLGASFRSDCAALHGLLNPLLQEKFELRCMRDPTRGGVATTLNEFAQESGCGIVIDERALPIAPRVRGACELLGIDPLYVANEGKALIVVARPDAEKVARQLRCHALGRRARIIGEVVKSPKGRVILTTSSGTSRIVDMLESDPLPRIC
jgi:hydrogenase expression/formation protein HypE